MTPLETFTPSSLNSADIINITIRIGVLFILGLVSQLSLQKKFYAMTLFTLGVWLTFFRLTLLRAILLYVGVFKPNVTSVSTSQQIYIFLQSSAFANFISLVVLIGSIQLLLWIKKCYDKT